MNQACPTDFRYRAFISYSHRDRRWAEWLHRALETYRVPSRLVGLVTAAGTVPRRLAPIFRDREELASSSDLGGKVDLALAQSANLIVVCSPAAATSRWVGAEVRAFRRLGRSDRIFCLIVAGEPNAPAAQRTEECLSAALCGPLAEDGVPADREPVAADVRPGKDGRHSAKLKLVAGLLGLELDQLRRRELQRRNRRLAVAAALSTLVMLVTTLLAIDAMIARRAAERRQKQAEALVGFMLGDLNDKLGQVQRLDILEAVDDKAMAYFRSLPATDVTDDVLEQRAKALEKIGSVRMDQGRLAAATSAYLAAEPLANALARAAPADRERQIAYARVQAFLGMSDWYQGHLEAAGRSFAAAQATLERMGAPARTDPRVLFELSTLDNDIGHVLEARGRLDEAELHYRRMLERCRLLVAHPAPHSEWFEHLGEAHNNLGKMALMRGDLLAAIAEYAADDGIETKLSENHPQDNGQRQNMARVRAILARTLALAGRAAQADRDTEQALAVIEEIHRFDPSLTDAKENLGLYSIQLARLRRVQGDTGASHAPLVRGLRALDELARHDPSNTGWQQDLAEARVERAAWLQATGHRDDARRDAQAALAVLAPLLADQPDERSLLLSTARARLQLASLQSGRAAEHLRLSALESLRGVHSGAGDVRLLAAQVDALLALGRIDEARPLVRRLWLSGYREPALAQSLASAHIAFPPNPAFEQRLQDVLDQRALALAR
ncbi:TIR domain-containing protein [Frateuria sp. YIM B11624]|uniref:toll/interleukin-1 receptor domain-containing protein n=1 Tax=Frateuria sp. YIM B11624 TaxID=3143185 RepID=UPI003C7426CF